MEHVINVTIMWLVLCNTAKSRNICAISAVHKLYSYQGGSHLWCRDGRCCGDFHVQ